MSDQVHESESQNQVPEGAAFSVGQSYLRAPRYVAQ
ncbi:hypothetical protein AVEN_274388-1, partial [Araneus ventricosus]